MRSRAHFLIAWIAVSLALPGTPAFAQDTGVYRLAAVLEAPAACAEGWFGNSVAMDAEHVIVGEAFGDAGSTRRAGRAHLFTAAGDLLRSFQSPSPRKEGNFGGEEYANKLVAVNGERCAAGETRGQGGGKVHLFGPDGTLVTSTRPPEPPRGQSREYGNSVALTPEFLLVGAWNVGAYLYDSSGSLAASLKASDGSARDGFGMAVAMAGDTIVVTQDHATAGGVREAGMAYLYDARGGLKRAIKAPAPSEGALFGVSADTDGELVVIGAPAATADGRSGAGLAYLFGADGELRRVLSSPVPSLAFGVSVAVDHGRLVVGASGTKVDDQRGAGLAFVFDRDGTCLATLRPPKALAGASFGWSVAASDGVIAVSAPGEEAGGKAAAGKVYLFTAP
jgi:hypothetical protein